MLIDLNGSTKVALCIHLKINIEHRLAYGEDW